MDTDCNLTPEIKRITDGIRPHDTNIITARNQNLRKMEQSYSEKIHRDDSQLEKPLVSVIMPMYNSEKTVELAIASVQRQDLKSWELIVLDDGSTDASAQIVEQIKSKDSRIRLIVSSINGGVAARRNDGIELANGKYIAFLDSDDCWKADKLHRQLELLQKTGAQLCYTGYCIQGLDGQTDQGYYPPEQTSYEEMLCENVVGCSTVLVEKSCLPCAPFSSRFFHEDYALWLILLRKGVCFVGIPELLVNYRCGGRSSNKLKAALKRWEIYRKQESLSILRAGKYLWSYAWRAKRKYRL
ncbi:MULTISPECIES: glycosyltransferase family 2 protein [Anaerotruncus]|jgi:teichuronic acid biosynthesis glycosyltransferase TuaG|uniref:Glycosyltransferase family 2 protein n=1 Tax=Anaerotruncus colihominis TaxID=169435 RepID=A0A845SZM2_9FIRM|nr:MULTISPECIES: glycosyltransferase family 2 protein [Anaerotruncus]MCI8492604.1 glycosyltransferase family 2 protein [Anaerotruncus sp.]NDO39950.1 glycosyltransferase family 2 protein [Anaerotruncus colihominis]